jgi:predicted outer membrane repeat protein
VDFHVAAAQDLQNALTLAAANGANNNIYVNSGYYTGNFNYNSSANYNLVVTNEVGVANTQITIDDAGGGRAFNISSSGSGNITVSGITFLRNCGSASIGSLRIGVGGGATILVNGCQFLSPKNSNGSGLEIASGLNATVSNCIAIGSSSSQGLGIIISGVTGAVTVQGCVLSTNNDQIGSIAFGGAFSISGSSTTTVNGNTISGNSAIVNGAGAISGSGGVVFSSNNVMGNISTAYGGGGVTISGSTALISGNNFTGNISHGGGNFWSGAVYCISITQTFLNNTFSGNLGASGGGGVYAEGGSTLTFSNNNFAGNTADSGAGLYIRGSVSGSAVALSGNTFSGNVSGSDGGGFYCQSVTSQPVTTVTANRNYFSGNSATGSGGGAYFSATTSLISNNTFQQNSATTSGGGIYASGSTVTISDNLVAKNSSGSYSIGGGIWVNATTNLYFLNNTITGNVSAGGGGGAAFQISGLAEVLNVDNNIIWGNSGSPGADVWLSGTGQERVFSNNDAHDLFGIWDLFVNNLDADPQFVAPASGNYHLQKGSPCLDAGTTAAPSIPAVDLDGNPRIVGGTVDLGCYELSAPVPLMVSLSLPPAGGIRLQWPSAAGATYIVQQSTDLKQGFHNWTGALPATPPVNTYSDAFEPGAATVFYRIKVQ